MLGAVQRRRGTAGPAPYQPFARQDAAFRWADAHPLAAELRCAPTSIASLHVERRLAAGLQSESATKNLQCMWMELVPLLGAMQQVSLTLYLHWRATSDQHNRSACMHCDND